MKTAESVQWPDKRSGRGQSRFTEDASALAMDCGDPAFHWSPQSRLYPGPDVNWKGWLLDPGSLTQRLKHLSDGDFRVQVIDEGWSMRYRQSLQSCFGGVLTRQAMWSRKVVLLGHGRPWVSAHSLVPVSSLNSPLRRICKLQDRPLGEFLFSYPGLRRTRLELTRTDTGWGRRSLFHLYGKPILVAEFFLPELIFAQQEKERG